MKPRRSDVVDNDKLFETYTYFYWSLIPFKIDTQSLEKDIEKANQKLHV